MQIILIGIIVIGSVIYAANMQQVETERNSSIVTGALVAFSILGIVLGMTVLLSALNLPAENLDADIEVEISIATAIIFLLLSFALSGISILTIFSNKFRLWLERVVFRSDKQNRRYRADSIVHTTAIVIAMLYIIIIISSFILSGGIEGLAAELQESGLAFDELFGNLLLNVLVAVLGVGLFIRRDVRTTLQRLGLDSVRGKNLIYGAGIGFVLFWLSSGLLLAWTFVSSPETIAEQSAASEQLFLAFSGSLFAGFILAMTSAIGEEILFRGALQPIFGMVWSSIFFAILHTQYTLTPAALVIFGVSMVFAWIRQRFDTTTAIVAHFLYNFVPFVLFWVVSQFSVEALIP